MPSDLPEWFVYRGSLEPTPAVAIDPWLNNPPPWRRPLAALTDTQAPAIDASGERRGSTYVLEDLAHLRLINAALLLRKPILVEGDPGLGKSLLAWSLAYRLGLGTPLVWAVNSRSTLADALYRYEAIAHLQAGRSAQESTATAPADGLKKAGDSDGKIGRFITLGPLGTAMIPGARPRVLLVDEVDKASFDLPNDLLHVLEERQFAIPELLRLETAEVEVVTWDSRSVGMVKVPITRGRIEAGHFPVVVFTSNGAREFPTAFLRRCVRVRLERPDTVVLGRIASAQLEREVTSAEVEDAIHAFAKAGLATDQVLSSLFLSHQYGVPLEETTLAVSRKAGD